MKAESCPVLKGFYDLTPFISSQSPDFGGAIRPVRAKLSGVTRKVSSYSIHTLLCSVEHKNPSLDGFWEYRFPPSMNRECILLLGGNIAVSPSAFQRLKTPNAAIRRHYLLPLTKRYKYRFSLVFLPYELTQGGSIGTYGSRAKPTNV